MSFHPKLPPIRQLLIPDPDWCIIDADLDRADVHICAWEADAKRLKEILRSGVDLHQANADLMGCTRQAAKNGIHACLTEDHEVLTREGWKPITNKPNEILCWHPNINFLTFETITHWHDSITTTEFLEWDTFSFSQKVTYDHKMPYKCTNYLGSKILSTQAYKLPQRAQIPKSGFYHNDRDSHYSPTEIRLLCAFQADGSLVKGRYVFHLKKERKIQRLHKLLDALKIEFIFSRYDDGATGTRFTHKLYPKQLGPYIFDLSQEAIDAYVDEAAYWDGHTGKTFKYFYTANKEHAEWFAIMAHLCGKASQHRKGDRTYIQTINNRPHFVKTPPIQSYGTARVLCPKTPTGFFMVRRNGAISITGNTDYYCKARTLSATLHCTVEEAEDFTRRYFSLNPEIPEWHRKVRRELQFKRQVRNVFNFRRFYFDRMRPGNPDDIDRILPQALAWLGSSPVSVVINRGAKALDCARQMVGQPRCGHCLECEQPGTFRHGLQVHDSIVAQVPISRCPEIFPEILRRMRVEVPYADPLIIPASIKYSTVSWGRARAWQPGDPFIDDRYDTHMPMEDAA